MEPMTNILQDVPLGGVIALIALTLSGLAVWAAGQRVLRFVLVGAGVILGGCIGWMVGAILPVDVAPAVTAAIGGLVLAILALTTWKMIAPMGLALVLGVASPSCVWTLHELGVIDAGEIISDEDEGLVSDETFDGLADEPQSMEDELSEWVESHFEQAAGDAASERLDEQVQDLKRSLSPETKEGLREAKSLAERVLNVAGNAWQQTPEKVRIALVIAAILGGLTGLLLGMVFKQATVTLVTAFGGSLLWLASGRILIERLGSSEEPWLPGSVHIWLLIWLVTAAIGVGIQWMIRPKKADTRG